MPAHKQDAVKRFWSKVDKKGPNECWLWTASQDGWGYGQFWLENKMTAAHRFSHQLSVGPIPIGMEMDHLCRNRACVNPSHLEPVTKLENSRRSPFKSERTHCSRGHEFTPENTRPRLCKYRIGQRCRTCENTRARELDRIRREAKNG